ncbi:MAG: hypothetical protein AAF570_10885, partial [Bacteroidota bacterium]
LEFFTENRRIESKLALKAQWDFDLTGPTKNKGMSEIGGKKVDSDAPWNTRFWMGCFDGDVMRGYMRGNLEVPVS